MGYHVNACALQDICQQVFEAVHKGDAATVPSLLLQHRLSPDLTNTVSNIIINFVVLCTTTLQKQIGCFNRRVHGYPGCRQAVVMRVLLWY